MKTEAWPCPCGLAIGGFTWAGECCHVGADRGVQLCLYWGDRKQTCGGDSHACVHCAIFGGLTVAFMAMLGNLFLQGHSACELVLWKSRARASFVASPMGFWNIGEVQWGEVGS